MPPRGDATLQQSVMFYVGRIVCKLRGEGNGQSLSVALLDEQGAWVLLAIETQADEKHLLFMSSTIE
jgi:hypothetical protein